MVLNTGAMSAPFLTTPISQSLGLNPLGMQNAAISAYGNLLPGLNNITQRIRYYSFYCWVIDAFFEKESSHNRNSQQRFIRRCEYLLALINGISEDSIGIPGISYAREELESGKELFDIEKATYNSDGSRTGTYWKGVSIFTTYAAVLRDLGLMGPHIKNRSLYDNTKDEEWITGCELASAFDTNISEDNKTLFWSIINNGHATLNELYQLSVDFYMKSVPIDSSEQKLLIKMLLQKDYPAISKDNSDSINRRETIKSYLQYSATKKGEDESFAEWMYKEFHNEQSDKPHKSGWYYYYVNEVWQYNSLIIFEILMRTLQNIYGSSWVDIDEYIESIVGKVSIEISNDSGTTLNDVLNNLPMDDSDNGDNNLEWVMEVSDAIIAILSLYKDNRRFSTHLLEARKRGISNYLDDWTHFESKFDKCLNIQFVTLFSSPF